MYSPRGCCARLKHGLEHRLDHRLEHRQEYRQEHRPGCFDPRPLGSCHHTTNWAPDGRQVVLLDPTLGNVSILLASLGPLVAGMVTKVKTHTTPKPLTYAWASAT